MAYKVFTNGSVLNASEINDNLMNQSVMVFSNSTARAAALTAPVEGMLTWLEDSNKYQYRNGSGAWVDLGGGGAIAQIVSTAKTDTFTTSSTSFTTVTGLTATITPATTSSKVLIMAQVTYSAADAFGNGLGFFKVTRGGTDIYRGDAASTRTRAVFGGRNTIDQVLVTESGSIQFLDSPSSTSAQTYQVEVVATGGAAVFINRSSNDADVDNRPRGASSITLMEVAG